MKEYTVTIWINDVEKATIGLRGGASPDVVNFPCGTEVQNGKVHSIENFEIKKIAQQHFNFIKKNIRDYIPESWWVYLQLNCNNV